MSKAPKKLGLEEKRQRCLDYFTETADFFPLKDLERLLPKAKGIVSQTVKEVLQSLVDDRLVNQEKIGTSVYFWAFPSQAMHTKRMLLEKLAAEEKALNAANASLAAQIEAQSMGKEDSEERRTLLVEMSRLEECNGDLNVELKRHEDNDPEVITRLKNEYMQAKEDCNRWTDNLFALQSYCCTNFGISRSDFLTQFGLEEDLDYVE